MSKVVLTLVVLFCLSCTSFAQESPPPCSAEIAFTNAKTAVNAADVFTLNLFSVVSQPSRCFVAEIHIAAAFYDLDENLICSGSVFLMNQSTNILSANIEVRTLNPLEFVRLIDARRPAAKRLFCNNLDGTAEVGSTQMATANTLRLRAIVLPSGSGLGIAEARMTLRVSK